MASTRDKILKAMADVSRHEMAILEKGSYSVDYIAGMVDAWGSAITLVTNMHLPDEDSGVTHSSQDIRGITKAIEHLARQTSDTNRILQTLR